MYEVGSRSAPTLPTHKCRRPEHLYSTVPVPSSDEESENPRCYMVLVGDGYLLSPLTASPPFAFLKLAT